LIYGCMVTITRICVFVPARLLPVSDGVPHWGILCFPSNCSRMRSRAANI
jgi:hypothetical protein